MVEKVVALFPSPRISGSLHDLGFQMFGVRSEF